MNKIEIEYRRKVFALPYDGVRDHLESADAADLKVLLLLAMDEDARASYPDNADTLAASVGLSRRAFDAAVSHWCECGVLTTSAPTANPTPQPEVKRAPSPTNVPDASRPSYSGAELESLVAESGELKMLIDGASDVLKKVLSPAEINKLVELSDYLRLSSEYILMLCYYMTTIGKSSVAYIYKAAYTLHDEGICDVIALDEYIKRRERQQDGVNKLRTLLGIGGRSLVPKEREAFERWIVEWSMPHEMFERAYEITISKTENHKFSLPYMNKILENWHNAGYKTVEDADNALAEYRREHDNGGVNASSFDTDEFFEAALRRSYQTDGGMTDGNK